MPITQQIGSSSLSKPGVCTSTTRPSSPYDGMVIYETDTDRTLVWNGSGWVYLSTSTANPVGMELIAGVGCSAGGTASNGVVTIGSGVSSVVVTNAFNANYDNYRILVSGGSFGVSTTDLELRLGSATSGYRYQFIYGNLATTLSTDGQTNAGRFPYVGITGSTGILADISVVSPFLSSATFISCHAGRAGNYLGTFTGVQVDAASYTSFSLASANPMTMTGGSIRVYGIRNSA